MRFFNLIFVIFDLILITTSAPNNTSTHKNSSHTSTSITHLPQIRSTRVLSHSITRSSFVSRTIPAVPFHTRPPESPGHPNGPHLRSGGHKPILIVFEVLGGLVASVFLLGLLRCCYRYKNAPKRDRIAEVLNRHHLQRELEELERNPHILRRPSLREPAPPYFPAPPSYDITTSAPTIAGVHQNEYTDMGTRNLRLSSSPLQSPQMPQFPSNSRQSPDLIPPRPAG